MSFSPPGNDVDAAPFRQRSFSCTELERFRRRGPGVGRPDAATTIDLFAYIDVFQTLAIIGALMARIALSLRTNDLNAPARGIITERTVAQALAEPGEDFSPTMQHGCVAPHR